MDRAGFQTTFAGPANAGAQTGVNFGQIVNNVHASAAGERDKALK